MPKCEAFTVDDKQCQRDAEEGHRTCSNSAHRKKEEDGKLGKQADEEVSKEKEAPKEQVKCCDCQKDFEEIKGKLDKILANQLEESEKWDKFFEMLRELPIEEQPIPVRKFLKRMGDMRSLDTEVDDKKSE